MSVFESTERHPVTYLPTGDRALLVAWTVTAVSYEMAKLRAVLCLEDGSPALATVEEFRFDYRYSNADQKWYDVSKISEGDNDADTDQGPPDHGGPPVPGLLPDSHWTGQGDPVDEP